MSFLCCGVDDEAFNFFLHRPCKSKLESSTFQGAVQGTLILANVKLSFYFAHTWICYFQSKTEPVCASSSCACEPFLLLKA